MDTISLSQSNEKTHCDSCHAAIDTDDVFCSNCGYPLRGTEKDQNYFLLLRTAKEIDLQVTRAKIKRASYALFYIAGAIIILGIVSYVESKDIRTKNVELLVNIILAVIFVGLGLWCKNKPLAAIISGSLLYAVIVVLNVIINPLTILSGLVFVFIIVCFISGIKSAIEAEKLRKELEFD